MKRFLSFIICVVLTIITFAGCDNEPTEVRIAGVMNSPYAQLSYMLEKSEGNNLYDSTPVNLPNRIRQIMTDGNCDIAVVPVETACTIYNRANPKIKILAGISTGGFELVTTEKITELKDLKDKTVYLTERNTLMESILEYMLNLNSVAVYNDVSIDYANDIEQLQESFKNKSVSFALMSSAEAAMVKSEINGLNSYNLTDELAKKFKKPSIITYCVIGTVEFIEQNPIAIKDLLKDLEFSVSKLNNFEETIKLSKKHSLLTGDIYNKEFLENLKPEFITGEAMQKKFNAYFKMLHKIKPSMVNKVINKEDLFYISE